jgi:FMN-dependent NADH-azoreductase
MNILHIDSSILGENSASRAITAEIVTRLRQRNRGLTVTRIDLDAEPLPHLTAGSLARADATEAARAERAMADFLAADIVVIGAPMYNFSIPSTLKAWIDRQDLPLHVQRSGRAGQGQARVPGDHPGRGA